MLLELIQGVSLLLSLCMLQSFILRWRTLTPWACRILSGLLFGGVCILGMVFPLVLVPGVIFDARSVILSLSGLFGGPIVACLAGILAAGYRWYLGGTGVWIGETVIVYCVSLGLLYRWAHACGRVALRVPQLALFSLLVQGGVVLLLLTLPNELAHQIRTQVAVPYLLTFTTAGVLLGVMLQDLHSYAETLRALEHSNARLRAITGAIPDPLFVLDAKGRILEVLASQGLLLAQKPSELLGRSIMDFLAMEQAQRILQAVSVTLETHSPQRVTYSLTTSSGEWTFEGHLQVLDRPLEGHHAVLMLSRDITQTQRQHQSLTELSQLTQKQHQRLKHFTYTVSHHIRCHVANLLGLLPLMKTDHQQEPLWPLLEQSVQRLDGVICELNQVLEIGHFPAQAFEPVSLHSALEQTLCRIHDQFPAPILALDNRVPAETEVCVIPSYLDEILFQLLSNAVRFAAPERELMIELSLQPSPTHTVLTICDNGRGLDLAKTGHKIFNLYQTFHAGISGKGLGLFLAKAQIEAMQGRLEIDSSPDVGTRISLHFQRTPQTSALVI